jgi:hypothetical protein
MEHPPVVRQLDIEIVAQGAARAKLVDRQRVDPGEESGILDLVDTAPVVSHLPTG